MEFTNLRYNLKKKDIFFYEDYMIFFLYITHLFQATLYYFSLSSLLFLQAPFVLESQTLFRTDNENKIKTKTYIYLSNFKRKGIFMRFLCISVLSIGKWIFLYCMFLRPCPFYKALLCKNRQDFLGTTYHEKENEISIL